MRTAKRIDELPPYLFASLDRKVQEARAKGVDVISFGVGDPDLPTPVHIVEAAQKAIADPATHQYPSYFGLPEFREAIAAYYQRRFEVKLDPDTQVLPLIGSKEGIAHLATAFIDPSDVALVCDPGYPVYSTSTILSGGSVRSVPLKADEGFLPDFGALDTSGAKVLWLNYPSNPTAATAGPDFFDEAVSFAKENDLLLAHDSAYAEITFDGFVAPSALQADGALEGVLEFGSLSKTYNMTGWRVGWAAGSAEAIEALGRVKTNIDSGIFNALQIAGVTALEGPQDSVAEMVATYTKRRDAVTDALGSSGLKVDPPKGSIYVWAPVPDGETSAGFAERLLGDAGVVVAPGTGYGKHGEGFVRFSLTISDLRLEEGMSRVAEALS